jgi:hypothetical protein
MAHAQDTQWQEFYDIDGVAYGKAAVLTRGLLHLGIDYLQADLFNYTMMKATWTNNITLPPEADIITAFKARLVVEKSLEYQGHRANKYPQVTEQLDQLYHDMKDGKLGVGATTGSWYVGISSVKDAYPKP